MQKILNKKSKGLVLVLLVVFAVLQSCKNKEQPIKVPVDVYFSAVDKITETMIHDIFSPPVASRIYMYPNVAAYEIITQNNTKYSSLTTKIKSLQPIPKATKDVNLEVAALVAYIDVSKELIFKDNIITTYADSLFTSWEKTNTTEFTVSKAYGLKVANRVKDWLHKDNYKETRSFAGYEVTTDNPGRWQPTPPAYMDGIEPHWNKIRPMVLDSASQFKPIRHPEFSMDPESTFYKELQEVYTVTNEIRKNGDTSEEVEIAKFWDCNPYVSTSKGHLMIATKKITPGAHWIGITKIACKQQKLDFTAAVHANTITSIGIFDAFISCWDEKYRSNLIRPETLINNTIDKEWTPLLQTPPFPEYTSGHSVVSGASATILTQLFGDNFSFSDDTETPYGLPVRKFSSFNNAAKEAAVSRLYGGIHYRAAIDNGVVQGQNVGKHIVETLNLTK
ncbi:PAP2 superfamily protein [Cellulophaga sp. RHA19]|uniref:vanadium-dependent haloperoxidase n=1 Tax=Cellulophaga sp. RHA19 TaxID=1798237 RepID=UPI000C2BF86B|nr:vanadium-dependent haloperoxidase [Cellulophaga sp. RHA19]PKB44352.1 PAP2 superfamily protein [Cellulophaga sp. RHA19]